MPLGKKEATSALVTEFFNLFIKITLSEEFLAFSYRILWWEMH